MSNPFERSLELLRQLHALDHAGMFESKEADAVRDKADSLWYQMTADEQTRIGKFSKKLYLQRRRWRFMERWLGPVLTVVGILLTFIGAFVWYFFRIRISP